MEEGIRKQATGNPRRVTELILDNSHATSISPLIAQFENLRVLTLNGIGLSSLKGFPSLVKLERLELSDNRLQEGLHHLAKANLSNLRVLKMSGNRFDRLEELLPLSKLVSLRSLDLFGCPVTKLNGYRSTLFSRIQNIEYLDGFDRQRNEEPEEDSEDEEDDEREVDVEVVDDDEDDESEDAQGVSDEEEEENSEEERELEEPLAGSKRKRELISLPSEEDLSDEEGGDSLLGMSESARKRRATGGKEVPRREFSDSEDSSSADSQAEEDESASRHATGGLSVPGYPPAREKGEEYVETPYESEEEEEEEPVEVSGGEEEEPVEVSGGEEEEQAEESDDSEGDDGSDDGFEESAAAGLRFLVEEPLDSDDGGVESDFVPSPGGSSGANSLGSDLDDDDESDRGFPMDKSVEFGTGELPGDGNDSW